MTTAAAAAKHFYKFNYKTIAALLTTRTANRPKGVDDDASILLLLVCVSLTIIGQPRNSVLIRRV